MQFAHARCWNGTAFELTTLAVRRGRIDHRPQSTGDVWDLQGALVLPAFVNAHDHLELNHYPRTRFRDTYTNAREWAAEMTRHLDDEPFASLRMPSFQDKVHAGLVKNLLSGVLTVIQHGTPHHALFSRTSPVTVMRRYGWAHSLYLTRPQDIQQAHRQTALTAHFFIHLAEGTDTAAHDEYEKLVELGCVDQRTVLIHGVGLSALQISDARQRGAMLITCPTTNHFLLGKVADAPAWKNSVMLGSDSRLTADGDFLDEVRCAVSLWGEAFVWKMLHHAASRSGIHAYTGLIHGAPADLVVVDGPLYRRHIILVMRQGRVLWGRDDLVRRQFPEAIPAFLDGQPCTFNPEVARWVQGGTLRESGLTFVPTAGRRRRWLRGM